MQANCEFKTQNRWPRLSSLYATTNREDAMAPLSNILAAPLVILLLLRLRTVAGADEANVANDTEVNDAFSAFTKILESDSAKGIREADCNWDATKATLWFLTKTSDQEKYSKLLPDDCSNRRVEVPKLRRFLAENGFFQTPGRIAFINRQDFHTNFICSESKDAQYIWKAEGWGGTTTNDNFNKAFNVGKKLKVPLAKDKGTYFAKITCLNPDEGKKCSHTIYAFFRPQPHITYPLRASDNSDDFKQGKHPIECTVKSSTQDSNTGPFTFAVRVPPKVLKKEATNKTKYTMHARCISEDYTNDPVKEDAKLQPFYVDLDDPDANNDLVAGTQISKFNDTAVQIRIKEVKKDIHATSYECLLIDKNGIPSTPNFKSLPHKRYSGVSHLHVRQQFFLFIPLGFCAVVIAVILIIWLIYRKNDYMEYDDGTPFAKISPTVAAEVEAEKKEEVEETKA